MAGQYDPRQQWQPDAQQRHYQPPQPQYQPGPQQPPYPQYAPQPPQAPRPAPPKGNAAKGCAMLGCGGAAAVFILVAILVNHGSGSGSTAAQQTQAAAPPAQSAAPAKAAAAQTLTYAVSGSPADVTYGPAGTNVAGTVPLHRSGPLGSPAYYAITAQLQGSGTVTCEIEIDGKVISSATASGGYNIAQCEIVQNPLSGNWQDANS